MISRIQDLTSVCELKIKEVLFRGGGDREYVRGKEVDRDSGMENDKE